MPAIPEKSLPPFHFEPATRILYTEADYVGRIAVGEGPRNLIQLHTIGRLMVIGAQTESVQVDSEMIPLKDFLLNPQDGHPQARDPQRLDVKDWSQKDYIDYGRWLDAVVRDPQKVKSRLSGRLLERASGVGIGPNIWYIRYAGEFHTLAAFYKGVNIIPARERHKYDSWSRQDLADYLECVFLSMQSQVEKEANRPPSLYRELKHRAQQGEGPGLSIFKRNGVKLKELLALNGYNDNVVMTPNNYVQLGVRFMEANNGEPPTKAAFDFLAESGQAPGSTGVTRIFQWPHYLRQVQKAYNAQLPPDLKKQIAAVKQEVSKNKLPGFVIENALDREIIFRKAKWSLVNELFPQLDIIEKKAIVKYVDRNNLERALCSVGKADSYDIQDAIDKLYISQDLWPSRQEHHLDYLKVPEELLTQC